MFLLLSSVLFHTGSLLINPAAWLEGCPVGSSEVVSFIVDDMFVHELVQLVKVEEGDHWVAVMLGVEVGIPEQDSHQQVGSAAASVLETVGVSIDFTVGMFQVAAVVDNWISGDDRDDPPKEHSLKAFGGSTKNGKEGDPVEKLDLSRSLKVFHDAAFLGVVKVAQGPGRSRVIHRDAGGGVEDAADAALESVKDVQELTNIGNASKGDVAERLVLEDVSRVVARKLGVLVDVVGVGVVLFVHDTLMLSKLKAKHTRVKENEVVDPLGLEGVAVEELVLSCERKALELESIEKVERNKDQKLFTSKAFLVVFIDHAPGEDAELVDSSDSRSHDTEIGKEAFEAFVVRFLHETNQDAVVEDSISLLAFRVLDIGPIFVVLVHVLQAIGIGLFVEELNQHVIGVAVAWLGEKWSCIGRHDGNSVVVVKCGYEAM